MGAISFQSKPAEFLVFCSISCKPLRTHRIPAQSENPRRLTPALPFDEDKPSNRCVNLHREHPRPPLFESDSKRFSLESGRVLLRHARPRYAAAPWPTIAPPRTPSYLPCWHACAEEPSSSSEGRLMSWSSKKTASTASGYIDRSRQMTLKAMSSISLRSPCRGYDGAQRRTRSTGKHCSGHCWPGSAGSRVSAKWLCHLHRSKRTTGVSHVNAQTCCESEFSTSIASKGCSLAKESPVMIHCTKIGEPGLTG